MSKERNTDFTLNSLDDLFTSQNERDNGYLPNVQDIPLELLDDFPNHPFKVRDDEDMLKLIESVSERGVLVPAIVRPKADGRYELISGHRRKRASECAEKKTLRCMVSDLDDDAATIIMVDSNEIINSIKNDMAEQENIFNQNRNNNMQIGIESNTFMNLPTFGFFQSIKFVGTKFNLG